MEVAPKAQPLRLLETNVLLALIENKESEISMVSMSWLLWMAFMFLFLVPSIGYGWGYRKWGPPYPRYIQRRRCVRAATASDFATFNHQAWGWGGDFVWMVLFIGILWAMVTLWWR